MIYISSLVREEAATHVVAAADGTGMAAPGGAAGGAGTESSGESRAEANNGAGQGWGPAGMDLMDLAPWGGGSGEERESTTVRL